MAMLKGKRDAAYEGRPNRPVTPETLVGSKRSGEPSRQTIARERALEELEAELEELEAERQKSEARPRERCVLPHGSRPVSRLRRVRLVNGGRLCQASDQNPWQLGAGLRTE